MYAMITAADRTFAIGEGAPAALRKIASATVTTGDIDADGRTDSEAASVTVSIERVGDVESLMFPPVIGAAVAVHESDTGALVVSGIIVRIRIDDQISLSVQL